VLDTLQKCLVLLAFVSYQAARSGGEAVVME
jgi:hypothetical protein